MTERKRENNFELKRRSYAAAKMKNPEEFQRELLIWILNAVHMARLNIRGRGGDVSTVTVAIEPLLKVDVLQRPKAAFPYLKEVLERFNCKLEMPEPKPKKTEEGKFMILVVVASNIRKARIRRLRSRLGKERRLRKRYEGGPRKGAKIQQDLRPQF